MDPALNILVAEEDPDAAFSLQRAFTAHGLARPIIVVGDGADAIGYISVEGADADRTRFTQPDMLFLDLKRPRVNGFEVLEWLQAHPDFRIIPTIVWTSSMDARDVKHAYCLGANSYLPEPGEFPELRAMLGRVLAHWDDCLRPGLVPHMPSCDEARKYHPFSGAHGG